MLSTGKKGNNLRLKYSCKFPGCTGAYYAGGTGKIKNRHFYKFPKESNKGTLTQWKRVCRIKDDVNCSNFYICEDHFLEKDFVNHSRHRLNYEVVPKHLELVVYNGTSCENMEEPVFVKCEPGWLSEGEETCDFEQQKDVTDNLQVKIEPDDILAVSNMEEVNLEIVREEHNTEEMPPAARSEESSLSGVPTHEFDSSSVHTVSEIEVIKVEESPEPVVSGAEQDLEVDQLYCNDVCGKSFEGQRNENQVLPNTGDGIFSCSECNKNFKKLRYLKTHIKNHNQEPTHVCSLCGKSFSNISNLKRHSLSHTDQRPFSCSFCSKAFKDIDSQKKHLRIHTGERPYQCKICSKTFVQIGTLKTHVYTHGSVELSHVCSTCGKAFPTVKKLKRHLVVHATETPYSCTTCGKSFRENQALKKHTVMHSIDRPFLCAICFRTFSRKEALKAHVVLHKDERPYSCSTCGKAFRRRSHLESHNLLHENTYNALCTVCGKMFKHRGALNIHMAAHSKELRSCAKCGEEFMHLPDFKQHLLSHVEVNVRPLVDSSTSIEDEQKP